MEHHDVALCNDKSVHMVQLPPAEPGERNAFETITRLMSTNGETNTDQASNITNSFATPNSIPSTDNQSNIIRQQFSRLTEELKTFTTIVSSNISEMTLAHKTAQENTGKMIENSISQAITKTQDTTVSPPATSYTNHQNIIYTSSTYNIHSAPNWYSDNYNRQNRSHGNTHPTYRHEELQTHPYTDFSDPQIHQISTNLNQSVVKLLRHQTDLAHNTQCLQTTDALHNIAKSSALQENVHFTNDIPIFKAKDFDEWLDQIDKVATLTNSTPCKLALTKSQGYFSKMIGSYPPTLGWNKIKSSGLLSHHTEDLAHITHFIRNLHNQELQHYIL